MTNEENKKIKKSSFGCTEVLVLLMVTCFLSMAFGYFLGTQKKEVLETEKDPYINKFVENYKYIISNYYKEVDKSALMDHAIKGMVESLGDDFSNFMSQSESNNFDANLNGSYEGIGISIALDKEERMTVVRVIEDSPASKAGIKLLDVIEAVGNESVVGKQPTDVTKIIQKSKEKKFILTINRDNEKMKIEVSRENITLKSVESKMLEKDGKKIGYIYIDIFALNTTEQFKKAIGELEKQAMDSLIIDVRDNGGGHLLAAQQMASLLLDKTNVIYQTETKGKIKKTYSDGKKNKTYPIVLLTNENTASGSEVLIAALKENIGAISIGTKTYGKGTVQELMDLSSGSHYKVTVKKWLTPKGNWINEKGIDPNIKIETTSLYNEDPKEENDNVLQGALEYLKDK